MARGSQQATQAATSAQNISNTNTGEASGVFNALAPTLEAQAAHPAGFAPATLAAMNTGAEQSAGGAEAAAVGQGALRAARTRNRGGADAATAASTRAASETLSKGLLGTQLANARLQEQQTSQAEGELGNLFSTTTGAGVNALGEVASNVNANTGAENASWDWAKDILDPVLSAAGQGASAWAKSGCWIAEAIYGTEDWRTWMLRAYLNGPFRSSLTGDLTMRLYLAIGQPVAWLARRSRLLRGLLRPLFDKALARALEAE